jgi:hypothetical protein
VTSVGTEVYTRDEKYKVDAGVSYVEFPDQFYGIGPDTPESNEEDYTPRSISVAAGLQRRLRSALHAGLRYEFAESKLVEREPDGALDERQHHRKRGWHAVGRGRALNRDTRDASTPRAEASARPAPCTTRAGWA